MDSYKHGLKETGLSFIIGFALIFVIVLSWHAIRYSMGNSILFAITLLLIICPPILAFEFVSKKRLDWDVGRFSWQSSPIVASSAINGWVTHQTFNNIQRSV